MLKKPIQKITFTIALCATAYSAQVAAQSSVQCVIGANGTLEAALIWRNTLGADRANALCRSAMPQRPIAQSPAATRPTLIASTSYAQAPARPFSTPTLSMQQLGTTNAEVVYVPMQGQRGSEEDFIPMH